MVTLVIERALADLAVDELALLVVLDPALRVPDARVALREVRDGLLFGAVPDLLDPLVEDVVVVTLVLLGLEQAAVDDDHDLELALGPFADTLAVDLRLAGHGEPCVAQPVPECVGVALGVGGAARAERERQSDSTDQSLDDLVHNKPLKG